MYPIVKYEGEVPKPKPGVLAVSTGYRDESPDFWVWVWDSYGFLCPVLNPQTLWELIRIESIRHGAARDAIGSKYHQPGVNAYRLQKSFEDEHADLKKIRLVDLTTPTNPSVKRYSPKGKREITLDDLDIKL